MPLFLQYPEDTVVDIRFLYHLIANHGYIVKHGVRRQICRPPGPLLLPPVWSKSKRRVSALDMAGQSSAGSKLGRVSLMLGVRTTLERGFGRVLTGRVRATVPYVCMSSYGER